MAGKTIEQLTELPQPLERTDRIVVCRDNVLYRCDVRDLPQKWSRRIEAVAPSLADFGTVINQNNCQFFNLDDGVRVYHDNNDAVTGSQITARLRDMPAGAWDVQIACVRGFSFKNFLHGGLVLFENATQRLVTFGYGVPNGGGQILLNRYASPTAFGSTAWVAEEKNLFFQFFRARKAGSNIEFLYGPDGVSWSYTFADALTTGFITAPDKWGFYIEANNGNAPALEITMDVLHWSESP